MIAAIEAPRRKTHGPLSIDEGLTENERRLYDEIPAELSHVPNPSFLSPGIEDELFGVGAADVSVPQWRAFPQEPDGPTSAPPKRTNLSAPDEARLFLRYNYARFRLGELIKAQAKRRTLPRAKDMVLWYQRMTRLRAGLVQANMPLVLSMAKQTTIGNVEFAELVGEGNMALLRSVEKFDVSRGFKFSTYACRAILKSFSRAARKTSRYRKLFPTEYDPELDRADYDVMKDELQRRDSVEALREVLTRNLARLNATERIVLVERFALESRGKGKTLTETGKVVGLTNERVRQIQGRALNKVRSALADHDMIP